MGPEKHPGLLAQAWSRPLREELLGTAFGLVVLWVFSLIVGHFVLVLVVALAMQSAMLPSLHSFVMDAPAGKEIGG